MYVLSSILATLLIYGLSKRLYQVTGTTFLSPLIVCPLLLISALLLFQIPYENYNQGGQWLTLMLQPATIALAVPLYKYKRVVKAYLKELLLGVTGGAVAAIISSILVAGHFGLSSQLLESLAPRSITTPMAINVSEAVGGNPAITAVFVILTGIIGILLAPPLFKLARIENPVTKGMMLGAAAHGTGTSKAHEGGSLQGAMASLTMIFMGLITTLLAPYLVPLCLGSLTLF
ncbi:MAG: LrgB family protein [Sporomusaceae bacterium]|nr:LrgB family protein [Sporomusaceae bacterium]